MSKIKKNGPPIIAVTTPTGNCAGATMIRAKVSAVTRNPAPKIALSGTSWRWSGPNLSLTACGIISPTKPTRPLKLTATAVMKAAVVKAIVFVFAVFIPMLLASSSPKLIAFN